MGKRHHPPAAASADNDGHHYETPHKRQRVEIVSSSANVTPSNGSGQHHFNSSSPFFCGTPYGGSPALNFSFTLTREFVDGTILTDLSLKDWRIGKPIGKGSFGEIFLASDDIFKPVTSENAKYVVKIEPHSNGPLFVEIHALLNTGKQSDTSPIPPGMPEYIASGSHYFKNERYRFLILKRYQRDLHSLVRNKRVDPKSIPTIAFQILDVLEHLHDKGYVHSDIKAENLMIGKVPVKELSDVRSTLFFERYQKNGSVHGGASMKSNKKTAAAVQNGFSSTPTVLASKKLSIEYGGSNPVRSCRGGGTMESETYQDMVKSHYLRPLKNIVYRDDSEDENDGKKGKKKRKKKRDGDTSRSFFYHITSKEVNENFKQINVQVSRDAASLVSNGSDKRDQKKKKKNGDAGGADALEDRIHLIDFGLASKYIESTGGHRPFCMDQRRAHDGTLEFTSRDAHMGAHARRSDMECLGYNLVFWSQGFLPWKDEKMLNQPEQVHRMKEYFMTDVREMLKTIYGEDCPKYLGEYLHYVGGLMYDERPDYDYLRSLFLQELRRLDVDLKQRPKLNVSDIAKLSIPIKTAEEAEITNKINHVKSMMKLGVLPFRESTLHNKTTSPKNLRSKRESTRASAGGKNGTKNGSAVKKEKKFSWSDILSSDPDQIARERAEKEFERADQMEEVVIRYSGNPTYAIRELENKRESGLLCGGWSGTDYIESEDYIKGYTKPMMDLLRKRQSQILRDICEDRQKSNKHNGNGVKKPPDDNGENEEVDERSEQGSDAESEEEEEDMEAEEEDAEEEQSGQEEEDEDVESEEEAADVEAEEDEKTEEEADSGNDEVEEDDEEEEEEDETVEAKRHTTQGRKQNSRGRRKKHTIRKEESDSDFINDAEEEEEENYENEEATDAEEADVVSVVSEVQLQRRKVRRRHFQSESSDQQDSDFNEQESSEYDSRDARGKGRERSRLNRAQPNSGRDQPYSKANSGTNTKVPVIARNNNNNNKPYYGDVDDSSHDVPSSQQQHYRLLKRRKSGLRERIRPTARSAKYHDDLQQQKAKRSPRKRHRYSDDEDYCQVDDSSCSSSHTASSLASSATTATNGSDFSDCLSSAAENNGTQSKRKSSRKRNVRYFSQSSRSRMSSNSRSSSVHNVANGTVTHSTTNGNGVHHHHRPTNGQTTNVRYGGDDDEFFDDDDTRDMDYSPRKKNKNGRKSNPTVIGATRKAVNHHLKKKNHAESKASSSCGAVHQLPFQTSDEPSTINSVAVCYFKEPTTNFQETFFYNRKRLQLS
ncbi:uncharacterized protein LOC129751395 isoform X2 [Uranotaenia lowii]|uniref:uncharacterized protein LOC129751395 isoform X2 n=1 Tax=Uranotaenia lowii TaxID=190385 RepID=UPI00247AE44A|nr:uncharacterized protein LOC129751395 isoform X2 [Uranotaenia lowii]